LFTREPKVLVAGINRTCWWFYVQIPSGPLCIKRGFEGIL